MTEEERSSESCDLDEARKTKAEARNEMILETVRACLLGITTLLTAWATWIGSLHTGLQETHFTESNNLASSATALYNDGSNLVMQDAVTWGVIQDYNLDMQAAIKEGDDLEVETTKAKIESIKEKCTPNFKAALDWSEETGRPPFEMEGYAQSYYEDASSCMEESQKILEVGKQDNLHSDRFGLITVIYALVLFLLGVVGTFKRSSNRIAITGVAVVLLVFGVLIMASIPLPEGFAISKFLGV